MFISIFMHLQLFCLLGFARFLVSSLPSTWYLTAQKSSVSSAGLAISLLPLCSTASPLTLTFSGGVVGEPLCSLLSPEE